MHTPISAWDYSGRHMGHAPFQSSSVSAPHPYCTRGPTFPLPSSGVTYRFDVLPTTSLAGGTELSTEFLSFSLDLCAECCLGPSQELLANLEK